MSLDDATRARIDRLIEQNPVLLFMKGERGRPQCGFSATVVGILDGFVPEYATVDVLSDPEIREGIKAYSAWPTIPQLYVRGEFVGGCDIIQELQASGELAQARGIELPAADVVPSITITGASTHPGCVDPSSSARPVRSGSCPLAPVGEIVHQVPL